MEQRLYSQLVMIRQKDSDNKNKVEKTKKYNFQGQSSISIRCFDLDHEWLEDNFRTREPDFYKNIYQKHINVQETKTYLLFVVPIGNAKITENVVFHPAAPVRKYHQNSSNSCCLSSLE